MNAPRFRESLTINTITTVLILLGSAAASKILIALTSDQWTFLSNNALAFGVLSAVVLAGIGIYTWRRIDRFRPHFTRLNPDYTVVSKEVSYEYESRTKLKYVKIVTIRAERDGIQTFHDKYNWTGSGNIDIDSLVQEHTIRPLGQRNIWQAYEVDFGKTLNKGDTERIAVRWRLEDPEMRAVTFMSQSIDVPTRRLQFRIKVPDEFNVRHGRSVIRQTIDTMNVVKSSDIDVINGEAAWLIEKPKLLHCYELSWVDPGAATTPVQATSIDGEHLDTRGA